MEFSKVDGWPLISLLGTEERLNFTFQLGPPGGRRGYQVMLSYFQSKITFDTISVIFTVRFKEIDINRGNFLF